MMARNLYARAALMALAALVGCSPPAPKQKREAAPPIAAAPAPAPSSAAPAPVPPPEEPPPPVTTPPLKETGAPFVDRFDSLDEAGRWFLSDGWWSGDWMSSRWLRSQVSLGPEGVELAAQPAAEAEPVKPYVGGEISTHQAFRYGYFEARLKAPRGNGMVAGFFTYALASKGHPAQEIDVEIVGRTTRFVEFTYHVGGRREWYRMQMPFDAADDFHTYAFEWRPGRIDWYLDGKHAHSTAGAPTPIPNQPQRLFADLWMSEKLPMWLGGPIENKSAPWRLTISCMGYARERPARPLCALSPPS